ncbi:putative reverse transcriptase domain-containing protein [Tanacetum coccineum]
MLVEKKYPLRKEVLMKMLKLKLESEEDSTMALELIRHKNWLVHKQTACGKDFSNPFMVDNLPKIVRFSTHLASVVKSWLVHDQTVHALASPKANELTIPEQTATGKGTSNPLMAVEVTSYSNVVADALSRKERVKPKRVRAMNMILQSSIKDRILAAQKEAVDEFAVLQKGLDEMIEQRSDGTLYYLDRIWVPLKGEVRTLIMDEAHKSKYSVHLGADKMYYDLRDRYWWPGMKKDIAEYSMQEALGTRLDMSTTYHPRTDGQSECTIQNLEDMLRACVLDFGGRWDIHLPLVEFSYNNSQLIGPELVQETTKKISHIKDRLKAARDRQKSYADKRRKPLEFSVGDYVLLKVSPWKGVVRFGKKGKLAPRFFGPFKIVEKVGPVAYQLDFLEELSGVHDTFHTMEILEREFKKLKHSRISIVKVRWNSKRGPEFTWEREDQMKLKYPHLFSDENVGNVIVNGNRVGCSYKEFLACNAKEYDGKGGAVVLTCWIEKMESVHYMIGCSIDQKLKFTASLVVGKALMWWNSQIRTLSQKVAISMSWNDFKCMMIQKFCPCHEMQKLETELWNHAMVGVGHAAYTDRFYELARLVLHLVTPESRMIERYVYGLAIQIRRMVAAMEPKTIQKAMQISGALTDEGKERIWELGPSVPPATPTMHPEGLVAHASTVTAYVIWQRIVEVCQGIMNKAQGPEENRPNQVAANNGGLGRGNQGNQARGRAFMLGAEEARQDPNIVIGTFTLNNHFSTALFDSSADYSFVSTTFIPMLRLEPIDLGFIYEIEIASGQLVEIDKVIKGCKLEIEGHVFDIDLKPFGHGSFYVIIGIDWLSNYKAEIICHEKVVRIPLPDGKVLRVIGERQEEKMRHLRSAKTKEQKKEEIVVVRDYPEVFLDDLSGLPPNREIEFYIELVPRAILVAKSP